MAQRSTAATGGNEPPVEAVEALAAAERAAAAALARVDHLRVELPPAAFEARLRSQCALKTDC